MEQNSAELKKTNSQKVGLCIICNSKNILTTNNTNQPTQFSKQLNVIFILKYLLNIPTSQLEQFLLKYGNPENWISLCQQCSQLTGEAESLHFQILQISSTLKAIKVEILETAKQPIKISATKFKDNSKFIIWKDVKEAIKNDKSPSTGHPKEPPSSGRPKLKAEIDYPPSTNNSSEKLNFEQNENDHQCCPNCSTKFPTQPTNYPDDTTILPSTAFIGESQQCLYCPIEYPSISSLFKHMQLDHNIDRLPCLHPGCGATLKNLKQYFKHRQTHRRKGESIKSSDQLNLTQNQNEDNIKITNESTHTQNIQPIIEESTTIEQDSISPDQLNDNDSQDNYSDKGEHEHVQDNPIEDDNDLQDSYNDDNDNDWLPSSPPEGIDIESDIKINEMNSPDNQNIDINLPLSSSDNAEVPKLPKKVYKAEVQKCPKCPSKFPSITSTLKHMSTFHKMTRLPCLHSGCQQTLKNLKQYFKHRSKHFRPPPPPKQKKPPKPKVKVKEGPQLCDLCGASFNSASGLYSHRKCVHGDKKYKRVYVDATCHICGITLKGCRLKMHMLRKHSDNCGEEYNGSFYKCGVIGCRRDFIHKVSLDKHMDKMHDGWREEGTGEMGTRGKFECKYCGKCFHLRGKLGQHELAHQNNLEGKKPWICDICGKGFGMPANLDNHKKYTHKLAGKFENGKNEDKHNVM